MANSLTSQNQIKCFYKNEKKLISDYDYISGGNKHFLSNWKLSGNIISLPEKNTIKYYFSSCIYGNIEEFTYEKENIQIILISRRYLWNYGIYNYRRGLSKYGGNSNQIETELILIHNHKEIYSNIHLSSYIPIYFKSKKNVVMTDANRALIKYFQNLIDEYNALFLFLLKSNDEEEKYINKFKNMLLKNLKAMPNKWKYYFINNKNITLRNKLYSLKGKKNIIDFIGFNILKDYSQYDHSKNQIGIISLLSMDDKILYQNQLNLVYETICHFLIYMNKNNKINLFLNKDININLYEEENIENNKNEKKEIIEKNENNNDNEKIEEMETLKINENINIENLKFNENENNSNQIINEESLNIINNLKVMFKNRANELTKQYYTTYDDELCKKYQRAYEILFGKNMKYSNIIDHLNDFREDFSDLEKITIYVGTWNTGSTEFNKIKDINLDSWLKPKTKELIPDIYFIGFQEVIELNAANVIMNNEEKQQQILDEWDKKINESIQKIGKYKKLVEMNLVGINFYFYILEEKKDKVKHISKKFVKTGLGGTAGNKGSCCINFEYENTTISVACSHLAAGNRNKQRLKELGFVLNLKLNSFFNPENDEDNSKLYTIDQILEDILPFEEDNITSIMNVNNYNNYNTNNEHKNSGENYNDELKILGEINESTFKDSDIWILFGDLNFRVDIEYEEFSQYMKKGSCWNKLLDYDQFIKYKLASIDSMANIQEDEIKFPPTYKYVINSNEYDYTPENPTNNQNQNDNLKKSGKKRNPSWCDRIFYKKNAFTTKDGKKIITGVEYNNVMDDNFQTSDHRPIYQIFDVIIFKEKPDIKKIIEREIIANEKMGISNKYMKKKNYDY